MPNYPTELMCNDCQGTWKSTAPPVQMKFNKCPYCKSDDFSPLGNRKRFCQCEYEIENNIPRTIFCLAPCN